MKKVWLSLILVLPALASLAQQAGRIRITLVGAQCNKETADDMLQLDGKGDEVFFNFNFVLADAAGNSKLNYQKRTKVYGDNHGVFTNRINAGSCVDAFGNLRGGIRGGDIFYCNELMGEYDMAATDVLTITPTLWEWDGGSDVMATFTNAMNNLTRPIGMKAAQLAGSINPTAGAIANVYVTADQLLLPNFTNIFTNIVGKAGDRPVGMTMNGAFGPKQLLLKPSYISTVVNSNMGYGLGVLSVNYDEEALGNSRDHGNYTILIKIEYVPKPGSTTAAPPPANGNSGTPPPPASGNNGYVPPPPASSNNNSTTKTPPPPPAAPAVVNANIKTGTIRTLPAGAVVATRAFSIAGTWVGTFGNGSNNTGNFYSFVIGDNGSFQVVNNAGGVIANGKYTFVNNTFSGTYSYTNNGSTFSITATPDAAGVLNGTWGPNNNYSGSGRWTMTKK